MPRGIRNAATACLLLSAVVGFWAASEAWGLFRIDESESEPAWSVPSEDPTTQKAVDEGMEELQRKYVSALRGIRNERAIILVGLSLACALTFVGASRILRPVGLPREGVRRLLAGAALAAGVLRTVDGAQMAAVWQRQGPLLAKVAAALHFVYHWSPEIGVAMAIGQTVLIAGSFLIVSQYFRSERVKRIVEFRDSHPE